jgi:hypothetical protein
VGERFEIARRFRGPPDSGNGGYVAGLLASHIEGPARVRLRLPPPLETRLEVVPRDEGLALLAGEEVVATASPATLELEVPTAPSPAAVAAAVRDAPPPPKHIFPGCFVCGPKRTPGDGLCIFPVSFTPPGTAVAPWTPDPSLADASGAVRPEFLWAALDCPGAFALQAWGRTSVLLGELTARIDASPRADAACIALGWSLGNDGRKHYAGTAVFADGALCGVARAVWIQVDS